MKLVCLIQSNITMIEYVKQEEIVKSSETRLKLALDKDKKFQENIKELDNIKKEIAELREHLKINK